MYQERKIKRRGRKKKKGPADTEREGKVADPVGVHPPPPPSTHPPPTPCLVLPSSPLQQVRAFGFLAAAAAAAAYQTHRSVSLSNSGIHLIIALTTAY